MIERPGIDELNVKCLANGDGFIAQNCRARIEVGRC
jgi:hypothetical protein